MNLNNGLKLSVLQPNFRCSSKYWQIGTTILHFTLFEMQDGSNLVTKYTEIEFDTCMLSAREKWVNYDYYLSLSI